MTNGALCSSHLDEIPAERCQLANTITLLYNSANLQDAQWKIIKAWDALRNIEIEATQPYYYFQAF